ncbi:MAG: glycosyltransferase family 2 protein [Armatimonas sp.]
MREQVTGLLKSAYKSYQSRINSNTNIGVLAIAKNEGRNIREWVEHYQWQGVDSIFLIDNGSTDNTRELIQDYIDSGFVEYFYKPERHKQVAHYRAVFQKARIPKKVGWLIMADMDEFWFSPSGSLKTAIDSVSRDADLIYANWLIFGSSGHVEHPESIRKGFLLRDPQPTRHCNTKWICRTRCIRTRYALGIHKIRWVDSRRVVTDNENFRLNHYMIQSLQYFEEVKMPRGSCRTKTLDAFRNRDYFRQVDSLATYEDRTLSDMLP